MSYGLTHACADSLVAQFSTDDFKMALYNATLDQALAAYTATGEISGGSYPAGGYEVTMTVSASSDSGAYTVQVTPDVVDATIPSQVQSLMIYNVTQANRSVLVAPVVGAVEAGTLVVRFAMPLISLSV